IGVLDLDRSRRLRRSPPPVPQFAYPTADARGRAGLLLAVDADTERRVDGPVEVEPVLVSDNADLGAVARLRLILPRLAFHQENVPGADLRLERLEPPAQGREQRLLRLVLDVPFGRGVQRPFVDLLVA